MNKVGYTHFAVEILNRLPDEVKEKLPDVRGLILGACVPDLAKTKN